MISFSKKLNLKQIKKEKTGVQPPLGRGICKELKIDLVQTKCDVNNNMCHICAKGFTDLNFKARVCFR